MFKESDDAVLILSIPQKIKKNLRIWYERCKEPLNEFCNTTTLHGLRHTVAPNYHSLERFFWSIMFIVATYSTITLCIQQLDRYNTRPTVVSIKKDFRNWFITYPAVTVCLHEKADPLLVEEYILKTWNVSTDNEDKYNYYFEFIQLVTSISLRTNLRLFWKYEHDTTLTNIDLMDIVVSVSRRFTLQTTTHNPKHNNLWITVMTEMGLCSTFNSVFSKYQSLKTWNAQTRTPDNFSHEVTDEDLLSCNYTSKQCYVRFILADYTANYYIHSPWEIVDSVTTNTRFIQQGQQVQVEYRVLQMTTDPDVRKLRHSQRKCKYPNEPISNKIPAYSNGLCQIDCRTKMAIIFCGCRPYFFMIGNVKPCNVIGVACLGKIMEVLVNMPTSLAKCQCVPQCNEINYIPHDQRPMSARNSSENRGTTVHLTLQMPKVIMNKNIIFTFEDLIGSFGGVSALLLGVSFMSIVEIITFICKLFIKLYSKS